MKRYEVVAKHLRAPIPVVGMEHLLMERKTALQAQVAERFRVARATGVPRPSVSLLSATLRAIKAQIARVGDA